MALSGQAKNVLQFLMNFKTNQIKINQNKQKQERIWNTDCMQYSSFVIYLSHILSKMLKT